MRELCGAVRGGRIVLSDTVIGAATSHDHAALRLSLDGDWDGLSLTAQFIDAHGGASFALVEREQDGTLLIPIPFAVTRFAGTAHFTLRGIAVDGETETVAIAAAECDLTVLSSGWNAEAEAIVQPDATVVAQLQAQIAEKQDAEQGKGLSTNDYTDAEKAKVAQAHSHANMSLLDGITSALIAAGQRLLTLFASISAVATTLGDGDDTLPTSKAVADALARKVDKVTGKGLSTNDFTNAMKTKVNSAIPSSAKGVPLGVATLDDEGKVPAGQLPLSDVVAIGPSEQEESIVDENGVAHVPMVVSKTSEKRPGMVRTWSERYASAATDAGVLVAQPKTAAQFYAQTDGEDVVHENAFVAKGTLLHLMGDPDSGALLATKTEVAGSKLHYVQTATLSSPTNTFTVTLNEPLREVFCFVTVVGSGDASGNVAFRFKNGTQYASRTVGSITANGTKKGIVKFSGVCPGINVIERTTLSATAGLDTTLNEYVYSGGIASGEVTTVELAIASNGSGTFAVGTKIDICGVRA